MLRILFAIFTSWVLVSCGGGGGIDIAADTALSASAMSANAQAKGQPQRNTLIAGPISMVNTTTAGEQSLRTIGATADGGFVVAWISPGPTLFIQAFDSTGAKTGAETPIPLTIADVTQGVAAQAIQEASVAVLNDGSVVVAYRVTRIIDLLDGSPVAHSGVFFQRFDASGAQLAPETQVVTRDEPLFAPRAPFIDAPRVTALSDGGFVLAWAVRFFSTQLGSVSTLALRWFDAQGQLVGSPVEVGDFPQLAFRIVADNMGGFTLHTSQLDNFFNTDVSAFHYDATHAFQQIVAPRMGTVLLLPLQGGYVLFSGDIGGGFTMQLLDAQGGAIGAASTVASLPIAARELADGSFVVIWAVGAAANATFTAQRYAADGTPLGQALPIESNAATPVIVPLADTGFAAAWSAAIGTSDSDVFVQRFMESANAKKKACLDSAKGLKGQERKAFVEACLG